MSKWIDCRGCCAPDCDGCNIYTLATMLDEGKFDCLMDESHSIVIDPESLRPKVEWISVKDRLPEYDQVVLCYKGGRGVRIGKHMPATYADGVVAFKDLVRDYAFGATHWMPLPEPPNADNRGVEE